MNSNETPAAHEQELHEPSRSLPSELAILLEQSKPGRLLTAVVLVVNGFVLQMIGHSKLASGSIVHSLLFHQGYLTKAMLILLLAYPVFSTIKPVGSPIKHAALSLIALAVIHYFLFAIPLVGIISLVPSLLWYLNVYRPFSKLEHFNTPCA